MPHMIEAAKSGRASCRTCRKPIAKGELRLGEEVPNQFAAGEVTHQWHHLECAAKKKPAALKAALATTTENVPNRAELEAELNKAGKTEKPSNFPYAERAPTGRSSCLQCSQPIEKGTLRVAIEREVDTGSFVTKSAGYLHAAHAAEHTAKEAKALFDEITANSLNLDDQDKQALKDEMGL
jgi:poly [ADP-ribose] polymerase